MLHRLYKLKRYLNKTKINEILLFDLEYEPKKVVEELEYESSISFGGNILKLIRLFIEFEISRKNEKNIFRILDFFFEYLRDEKPKIISGDIHLFISEITQLAIDSVIPLKRYFENYLIRSHISTGEQIGNSNLLSPIFYREINRAIEKFPEIYEAISSIEIRLINQYKSELEIKFVIILEILY